jgi:hypothetical protein
MPVAALILLIQFSFIFHAYKTGRPWWWISIILIFPVIGCVAYYFVEVFPNSRQHRSALKTARKIDRAMNPTKEIRKRIDDLERCGSVDNKLSVAEECMNLKMYGEAARLYQGCLTGLHAEDADILFGLAQAEFHQKSYAQAYANIRTLRSKHPNYRASDVRLLLARTLEGMDQPEAALEEYEKVIVSFVGLEAKCRYAMLLQSLDRKTQAKHAFYEVLKHAKQFKLNREREREWIDIAERGSS